MPKTNGVWEFFVSIFSYLEFYAASYSRFSIWHMIKMKCHKWDNLYYDCTYKLPGQLSTPAERIGPFLTKAHQRQGLSDTVRSES